MTDRGDNDLACRMGGRHDTTGLGVTIDDDILTSCVWFVSNCN